ncbi:hypothetical protein CRM22_006443 [Opisthorchis felineus]|uniref:Hexosyltransferase n=1 Tax=Opisthorchis felineus TaxID=147828 RepID=A0A4S2LL07_OPIFE|nr:hypothetical protein CRM22_006443 [Opisthorchis felineus]
MLSRRRACAIGTCLRIILLFGSCFICCYFCILLGLWIVALVSQPQIYHKSPVLTSPPPQDFVDFTKYLYYTKRAWLEPAPFQPISKTSSSKLKTTAISSTHYTNLHKTSHCSTTSPKYAKVPTTPLEPISRLLPETAALLNKLSRNSVNPLTSESIMPAVCKLPYTDLLFVIFSEPRHSQQRNRIRHTWASLQYFKFDGESRIARIDYFFVVGLFGNAALGPSPANLLIDELDTERDILLLKVTGSETNRSRLHLLTAEWLLKHCDSKAGHVVFIEQDLIPNIPLLGSFIAAQKNIVELGPKPLYCFTIVGARPRRPKPRKPQQPFEVSQTEWPNPQYMPHCNLEQGGFAVTMQSLRLWYSCSTVHNPFKLDRVFLTGILREAARLPIRPYWTTHGSTVPLLPSSRHVAGKHIFFSQARLQPRGVWHGIFQGMLAESLK